MTAIKTIQLSKDYDDVRAVSNLDLEIAEGQFFGLLGRNGSGKTTTLQILATLVHPTSGLARVANYNVVDDPVKVRRHIGMVFQESALDGTLSAQENLRFAGALYGLSAATVKQRSKELLTLFDMQGCVNRKVLTLSGGMRRGLDMARGVLHRPAILLLDEPTIGLDVINRRAIWHYLDELREQGMTIILTTHYMEEASACDEVAFMSKGQIIGQGTSDALTQALGHYILEIEATDPAPIKARLSSQLGAPLCQGDRLQFRVTDETFPIGVIQGELKSHASSIQLRVPDLNDVYVWMNQ